MSTVERTIKDLVIANRILANLSIVDAFGDVSVRHPSDPARFFLARPVSPSFVVPADIIEFGIDGAPLGRDNPELPKERFIHAAIYEARQDVQAALHASPEDILPFGITQTPLRPVIAAVGDMGLRVPVWDIARRFGNATEVSTLEQRSRLLPRTKSRLPPARHGLRRDRAHAQRCGAARSLYPAQRPDNHGGQVVREDHRHFGRRGRGAARD